MATESAEPVRNSQTPPKIMAFGGIVLALFLVTCSPALAQAHMESTVQITASLDFRMASVDAPQDKPDPYKEREIRDLGDVGLMRQLKRFGGIVLFPCTIILLVVLVIRRGFD